MQGLPWSNGMDTVGQSRTLWTLWDRAGADGKIVGIAPFNVSHQKPSYVRYFSQQLQRTISVEICLQQQSAM